MLDTLIKIVAVIFFTIFSEDRPALNKLFKTINHWILLCIVIKTQLEHPSVLSEDQGKWLLWKCSATSTFCFINKEIFLAKRCIIWALQPYVIMFNFPSFPFSRYFLYFAMFAALSVTKYEHEIWFFFCSKFFVVFIAKFLKYYAVLAFSDLSIIYKRYAGPIFLLWLKQIWMVHYIHCSTHQGLNWQTSHQDYLHIVQVPCHILYLVTFCQHLTYQV